MHENLIDRSGYRHRVSGQLFRHDDTTHLVTPAGRKPSAILWNKTKQNEGQVTRMFPIDTLLTSLICFNLKYRLSDMLLSSFRGLSHS